MKKTALITGASSGLGREFSKIHASKGGDLVITARSADKLYELKDIIEKQHDSKVLVIPKDLSERKSPRELFEEIKQKNIEIEYLINNAGFGGFGLFHERSWEKDSSMIDVNIRALTELTKYFLPDMIKADKGRILNVASTAGYLPGPLQAVYYASKAYVISFSKAVSEELSGSNVTVTVLSPGPVSTNFFKNANLEHADFFKQNMETAESVAYKGYEAMINGKTELITPLSLRFAVKALLPVLPEKMVLKTSKKIMEKQ